MYDSTCVPHLDLMKLSDDLISTRGNQYRLIQHHCHYDLRKFNFTNRVIPIWNSLSNHIVSADTISLYWLPLVMAKSVAKVWAVMPHPHCYASLLSASPLLCQPPAGQEYVGSDGHRHLGICASPDIWCTCCKVTYFQWKEHCCCLSAVVICFFLNKNIKWIIQNIRLCASLITFILFHDNLYVLWYLL